jgi:hypothetical protein
VIFILIFRLNFKRPIMSTLRLPVAAMLALMLQFFIPTESSAHVTGMISVVIPVEAAVPVAAKTNVERKDRQRLTFLRRARLTWNVVRQFNRAWFKAEDPVEGDRLAKSSRKLGIIGISCLGGVIIPYVGSAAFLAALVLGIIAIVQGRSARRLGSKEKTGEKLGYITVGIWLLSLILAIAFIYLLLVSWGG